MQDRTGSQMLPSRRRCSRRADGKGRVAAARIAVRADQGAPRDLGFSVQDQGAPRIASPGELAVDSDRSLRVVPQEAAFAEWQRDNNGMLPYTSK